ARRILASATASGSASWMEVSHAGSRAWIRIWRWRGAMSDGGKQNGLEARLSRLETIVSALEREDLELDEALALFEEGIGHLREAQALIRTAELRIEQDRKSTRLNSSHVKISYAVFCL